MPYFRNSGVLLFTVFIFSIVISCDNSNNQVKPVRNDIIQAVYASGKLFPVNHYTVYSKFPGYIQNIYVKPGMAVKQGDLLLSIRNEVSTLNTNSAFNQAQLARQNADENGPVLNSLKQELASAEAKYALDSVQFSRISVLMNENASTRQAYDQGKTQADISKQNLERAKNNIINTRSKLKIEMLNAQNLLMSQRSAEKDYQILSIIDGKVYDVLPGIGELVSPQMPLMEAGDSANFEVELAVDETDISLIKKGQKVFYIIDAFPGKTFDGIVSEIFPRINQLSKTARIKSTFPQIENMTMLFGMSVEANIIISEKKNVLVIPKEYLLNGTQVKIKGNNNPVTVKTGISDLQNIEVISGISENDYLIK
jgi:HlyD family secretion protein